MEDSPGDEVGQLLVPTAEKFNRSATFVASYRLAREAGCDHYRAYDFARSAQQSMKGQSAKERAEVRKVLGGLLVMHGMAAGALGLPMVSTLLAVASMLGGD